MAVEGEPAAAVNTDVLYRAGNMTGLKRLIDPVTVSNDDSARFRAW